MQSTKLLQQRTPAALYALTAGAFGIGTTEFVIMGLLLQVAADLQVSIPAAGLLVSGYALGVFVGSALDGSNRPDAPQGDADSADGNIHCR
jgi:predicted MFS family arabinose efflux permease